MSPDLSCPPPPATVPMFPPLRPGSSRRYRLHRVLRLSRRAGVTVLAVAAAVLAVSGYAGKSPPGEGETAAAAVSTAGDEPSGGSASRGSATAARPGSEEAAGRRPANVSAPVRISDAAAVRLLVPDDRVDVLSSVATSQSSQGGSLGSTGPGSAPSADARVVARCVRVVEIPEPEAEDALSSGEGALVVLDVSRATASRLAGAAAAGRTAVTLC
ncbi:hypothetical protein [Streptomyces sparsus]